MTCHISRWGSDMDWLQANWFTIAVIVYAALSEVIGISPLKDNSVVQVVMSILGRVLKKDGTQGK